MIRSFLVLLIFLSRSFPQTSYTVETGKIDELLNSGYFLSSGISINIYDLTGNKQVYEKDSRKLFHPASNMKILTTAAGLLFLGGNYSFKTTVWYTGNVINNILYGDIYVQGGCDPDFVSGDLDSLINPILNAGIKEISGHIYFDISMKDSLFWGNGWMWDDDPSTDAPYMSALNINDNSVKVFVKPGEEGKPASVLTDPETDYVNIHNKTSTVFADSDNSINVDRNWIDRTNDIIVTGIISPLDTEYTASLNIYKPEEYFASLFIRRLLEKGISTAKSGGFCLVPANGVKLAVRERLFDSVLINLNKVSDNLSAEMVLLALAEKYYGRPASARNGLKLIDSLIVLAGKDPDDYVLADGSGVSHYNLVTTELINTILQYLYYNRNDLFIKLYHSFPVAGIDGTLKTRMRNTASENNVHAKTGTLSGVSSLSGYLTTKSRNMLSFSIMIQNFRGSSAAARKFQDDICNIFTDK